MADEAANAAAATEGQAAPAPTDPLEKAVAAIKAREEAADAGGKVASGAGAASSGGQASSRQQADGTQASTAATAATEKPRLGGAAAALAEREWRLQQKDREISAREAKWKPVDEALSKRDLHGALAHIAKEHGLNLGDIIAAIEDGKPEPKTPEQIARETVEAELKKRQDAEAKERETAQAAEIEAKVTEVRGQLEALAEKGAEGAPDRWELTAVAGVAGQAWDIIEGHYMQTSVFKDGQIVKRGEKLSFEQALDLIEAKLRAKRDARRPKKDDAKGGARPQQRGEAAASNGKGGKVLEPSFTSRTTSGSGPVTDPDEDRIDATTPEHLAIARAARKAGIRL